MIDSLMLMAWNQFHWQYLYFGICAGKNGGDNDDGKLKKFFCVLFMVTEVLSCYGGVWRRKREKQWW